MARPVVTALKDMQAGRWGDRERQPASHRCKSRRGGPVLCPLAYYDWNGGDDADARQDRWSTQEYRFVLGARHAVN